MLIKDLQSNSVFEYGGCHDSLSISEDGRTLSYYNLQCGEGSKYGDYRFVMEDGKIPAESETADAIHGCSYFDVGGRFMPRSIEELVRNAYEKGINDCLDIVEKVQAECIKNDGCRNKCDEPYACAYGTRIFGEILELKKQKEK